MTSVDTFWEISRLGYFVVVINLLAVSTVYCEAARASELDIRDHRDSFDAELAYFHAPIHYQGTATNNSRPRGDYITRFDYDGDWVGKNNWDNLPLFPLPAHAYYSVVESVTHWFIVYAFCHPQDWSSGGLDGQEHENDMEGELSIVRKDGSKFGKLEGVVTTFHFDFYSYTPADSPLRDGPLLDTGTKDDSGNPFRIRQDIDGRLTMQFYDGSFRPQTNQEPAGHGFKAFPYATGNFVTNKDPFQGITQGIVYVPSRTITEIPSSDNARNVKYALLDIFGPEGMWAHQLSDIRLPGDFRKAGPTFITWGRIWGDESGSCGVGLTRWCSPNRDTAPWLWDDSGMPGLSAPDVGVPPGEMALDPAHLVKMHFTGLGTFSETYIRNQYLTDLCKLGYHNARLPIGWPSGLDLNKMYSKFVGSPCR